MRFTYFRLSSIFAVAITAGISLCLGTDASVHAQQATIGTPFRGGSDSFFENMGVGFGFNIRGGKGAVGLMPNGQRTPNGDIHFNWGGGGGPAFGGNDPGAAGRTGWRVQGKQGGFGINLFGGQGSNRSNTSTSPSITVGNGQWGSISDVTQRPFVTGVVPVVGQFQPGQLLGHGMMAPAVNPLHDRLARFNAAGGFSQGQGRHDPGHQGHNAGGGGGGHGGGDPAPVRSSSATHGDHSIAAIRAQQVVEDNEKEQEVLVLMERARGAEEGGKFGAAKIYYRMALRRTADEDRKKELEEKIRILQGSSSP